MLLAVDVGNTNVVFALFDEGDIRARWRIATDPRRTGDEYAVWLLQLMEIEGIERAAVTQVIVSTVVPRARHNLEVLGQKYFGVMPLFADETIRPIVDRVFPLDQAGDAHAYMETNANFGKIVLKVDD